ncbi:MAG TPA: hypothetical protein VMF59_11740 [Bacteroidota bacterium]|nr:hypothetical protein [Bacteroidota bacterium]
MVKIFVVVLVLSFAPSLRAEPQKPFTLRSGDLEITVSGNGEISEIRKRSSSWSTHVRGMTLLDSCTQTGEAGQERTVGGGIIYTRRFRAVGRDLGLTVVDRFTPEQSSIRWDVMVRGEGESWSTGIVTELSFADTAGARFWTAWGNPDQLSPLDRGERPETWHNPFAARPFRRMHLIYGGHFGKGAGYAIPVVSVMYPAARTGIGLAMSPADPLLEVHLETTPGGDITQRRNFNRLGDGRTVTFTMHLFLHEPDWRPVVAFVAAKYPAFFQPAARHALDVCGLGAYSSFEGTVDAAKYQRMGGIVNWKASFDFSYMGMFIPPVAGDTTRWKRFDATSGGDPAPGAATYTSIAQMARYASRMKALGFSTLNYFNITEFGGFSAFGKTVAYPDPHFSGAEDVWTNPAAYLYDNFPHALVFGVVDDTGWHKRSPQDLMHLHVTFLDRPFWTWGGAVITDVGDPSYARFLLRQAELHVEKFPDAQGIAIDRFDWLNEYNWHADDGRTWIGGRPVRSLLNSYKEFIPRLARVFHDSGKVVFCNPHMNRLDLMEWIDGVYNEFGQIGDNLNLSAFLTMYKPLICWTPDKGTVMKSPDEFFQRHLLMGAFPTAPYPGNDHTIEPDPEVERFYLDYGPMFTRMHGRSWVLLPRVVEVVRGGALCNIFTSERRVLVPLVMGTTDSAGVRIRQCARMGLFSGAKLETWYPGEEQPVTGSVTVRGDELDLSVPLRRGCAFLVLSH